MPNFVGAPKAAGVAVMREMAALALTFSVMTITSTVARGQTAPQQRSGAVSPGEKGQAERAIVIIGQRSIVSALQESEPEQTYDEDRVRSYDVSTLADLMDQIRAENGDDKPALLINGQPVRELGDVADLPVEALRRIEQFPRGSAQKIGGSVSQRAYNLVLKPSVRSATLTVSKEMTTEGGGGVDKGEALLTYIRKRDRVTVTLRGSNTRMLLESDRNVVQEPESYPFSALGNILPFNDGQVDPTLSQLVGQPVTVIALPNAPHPSLADLIAGANRLNPLNSSGYRSLRGESRPVELAVSGNKALTDRLAISFGARLGWNRTSSLHGLPSGLFLVASSNTWNPLSSTVLVALNDPSRPLQTRNITRSASLSATLNANFGNWHVALTSRFDQRNATYDSELNGSFAGGYLSVPDSVSPFDGAIARSIPITSRTAISQNLSRGIGLDGEGPLVRLPWGDVLARAGAGASWVSYDSSDSAGERGLHRRELSAKAGLTIPITGRKLLPGLGTSELALDAAIVNLGAFGTIRRHSIALNWSPITWLHLALSDSNDATPAPPETLSAPAVVIENVPYFDPVRSETAYVRLLTGGAGSLLNPSTQTRTLSASAAPLPRRNLQLNVEYRELVQRHLFGGLPEPTPAIVAAFPERFIRASTGQLIQVDSSTINFDQQSSRQVRFGFSFGATLAAGRLVSRGAPGVATRRLPPLSLQVSLQQTVTLSSTLLIRAGLPPIDLLAGGATGVGGGEQRNFVTANATIARGATGLRLSATYRGATDLQTGTLTAPDHLTFAPIYKADLRAFADLALVFPRSTAAKGGRLSLIAENLFNARQRVTNAAGLTPSAYQPAYRDPVGRTIQIELRKQF